MPCDFRNIDQCVTDAAGGLSDALGSGVSSVVGSAWEQVCRSFAEAAVSLLSEFAEAFVAFPQIDPRDAGIRSVYGISLGIAAVVASILLLVQITRTVITHDGAALAQGVVGVGKAALAFLLTLTIAGTALRASNELAVFITEKTFGDTEGLKEKLTAAFALKPGAPGASASLLLVLALVGIAVVLVLWFELLLANAAVAVLIGTSPIAAAGQASSFTAGWWPKLVSATIQLIILKPVIALVFAIGFTLTGQATTVGGVLSGMLILLLAALAWPAIARFFTFASVHVGGGTGLAAAVGFGAGRMNGTTAGVPALAGGDDFEAASTQRALSTHAARTGGGMGAAGKAAGGSVAGGLAAVAAALDAAQRATNALVGRMEQTAGHAGLEGAHPHPYPAGYPRQTPASFSRPGAPGQGPAPAGTGGDEDGVGPQAGGPADVFAPTVDGALPVDAHHVDPVVSQDRADTAAPDGLGHLPAAPAPDPGVPPITGDRNGPDPGAGADPGSAEGQR